MEHFDDPSTWVERRIAYTRSVAVSSIVGYILGIGDRHSQNILIDTKTAEVVHIDFGIVFEQSKLLGTPETVPFRLTRDIIDGFISGIEGTFRKCCEETLRVLRKNLSAIMAILNVVIHDPLYRWSLSPRFIMADRENEKVPKFADDMNSTTSRSDDGNNATPQNQFAKEAAERTLARIKLKLQGFDDPTGDYLSEEGQVDWVIREASSTENLSKLFPGWAPWL